MLNRYDDKIYIKNAKILKRTLDINGTTAKIVKGSRIKISTNKSSIEYNLKSGLVTLNGNKIVKLNSKFSDTRESEADFRISNVKPIQHMAYSLYRLDGYNPNNDKYLTKIEFEDFAREVNASLNKNVVDLRDSNRIPTLIKSEKKLNIVADFRKKETNNIIDLREKNSIIDLREKPVVAKKLNITADFRKNETKNEVINLRDDIKKIASINDRFYVLENNKEKIKRDLLASRSKSIKSSFVVELNMINGDIKITKENKISKSAALTKISNFLKRFIK